MRPRVLVIGICILLIIGLASATWFDEILFLFGFNTFSENEIITDIPVQVPPKPNATVQYELIDEKKVPTLKITAQKTSKVRWSIIHSDEGCILTEIQKGIYELNCEKEIKPTVKSVKGNISAVFKKGKGGKIKKAILTLGEPVIGKTITLGENSTQINATEGWSTQPRCWAACTSTYDDGFWTNCTSTEANYGGTLRVGDSGGLGTGAWFAVYLGFNVSKITSTPSSIEFCAYPTNAPTAGDVYIRWMNNTCSLVDAGDDDWDNPLWSLDHVSWYTGSDADQYKCVNLTSYATNINWTADCLNILLTNNHTGYCGGVDAYAVIQDADDANPPYLSYSTTTTTTTLAGKPWINKFNRKTGLPSFN